MAQLLVSGLVAVCHLAVPALAQGDSHASDADVVDNVDGMRTVLQEMLGDRAAACFEPHHVQVRPQQNDVRHRTHDGGVACRPLLPTALIV